MILQAGTPDFRFTLRAERSGKGSGRVYTVTYTATDASANGASASATVIVPHDHRKPGNGIGGDDGETGESTIQQSSTGTGGARGEDGQELPH